ncbi:MAG: AtpZ/AtpI family protein [Lachnospiraceae bacterium]|nr:AtpZ/AtpI family protein [Lachnospiraceae bacterium]
MSDNREVFTNFALITQLSIHMLTPIFLCVAIGLAVDKYFGTSVTVFFLIVGILAGGRNAYVLAMNATKKGKKKKADYISQEYKNSKKEK